MVQPDSRLLGPIMWVRGAFIAILWVIYTALWHTWSTWSVDPRFWQFGVMAGILAAEAVISAVLYLLLSPKRSALLVHLSLLIDTVTTTGLIMCTGYAGSYFQLFYVLIVLAAGLLYGQSTGIYYFLFISLANVAAIALDLLDPLARNVGKPTDNSYTVALALPTIVTGVAMPLVAFPMLLVHKLTNRGRYLEALYENISDGLLILDDVGRIVEVNGRVALMTGVGRTELIGAPLESLVAIGEGGAAVIQSQLRRCLAGEQVSFELLFERRGAAPLPVEINAQLVSGLSPGRVQAFARDISARRMMEAEIRRQNDELRRINQELQVGRDLALNASRLKSQFLANMSHELRTPLNSIIGYTQFVLDDQERLVSDEQRDDLGRVLKSARHLLDLINGVLDVARIESGRESVSISRFGLADLVDSVIDAVTPMAKGKGLSIDCRVEAMLPDLQTDEKKLRQILLNLLANAVKFTERGSIRIDCRRHETDFVQIVVRDSGIGIPSEHLDAIFSEFHQVDPSIHKQYGGTGLGLAIVRRLAELLKGTIHVESMVGAGSTFTLEVPLTLSLTHDAAGKTTVVPVRSGESDESAPDQVVVFPDVPASVAADS
jgi:PAS domain S-box-containing protein